MLWRSIQTGLTCYWNVLVTSAAFLAVWGKENIKRIIPKPGGYGTELYAFGSNWKFSLDRKNSPVFY